MKAALLIFLITGTACFAQDTVLPFRYEGHGKWITTTEFVRQYDKDLEQLEYYDSAYAELEKQSVLYTMIIDSMKEQISMYKKILDVKNEIIVNKQNYIKMLERPQRTGGEKNPAFSFSGVSFNIGAFYKFDSHRVEAGEILSSLNYFWSVETGIELLGKFKLGAELIVPLELRMKGGYKL